MNREVDYAAVSVRLPTEMHDTIKRAAIADRRSFNAQLVTLLERILSPQGADRK